MPRDTVRLLLAELSTIRQTVLWKWENDSLPELPGNVIVRKWFPQNDVLGIVGRPSVVTRARGNMPRRRHDKGRGEKELDERR